MEYQIISNVAEKTSLVIEDNMLVGEVRGIVGAMIDAPEGAVTTMTYNGKALQLDQATWRDATATLHCKTSCNDRPTVRKLYCHVDLRAKQAVVNSDALRAVVPDKETVMEEERAQRAYARQLEPFIDATVRDPGFVDMILNSQPGLRKVIDEHPEVRAQIRNPEVLKTIFMSQLDPDRRREMNRSLELQLAQISAIPGGQMMLDRYMHSFLREQDQPVESATTEIQVESADSARPDPNKETNDEPLPNPWAQVAPHPQLATNGLAPHFAGGLPNPFFGVQPFATGGQPVGSQVDSATPLAAGADGFSGFPPMEVGMLQQAMRLLSSTYPLEEGAPSSLSDRTVPVPSAVPVSSQELDRTRFVAQLQVLHEMGFDDEALCLEALRATNGDVDAAVSFIADRHT